MENKSIWECVYGHLKIRGKKRAVGEFCREGFIFHSYERLIGDALAASQYFVENSEPSSPIAVCLGAYGKAVSMLACSILGRRLIVEDMSASGIKLQGEMPNREVFISDEEFKTAIVGILSRKTPISPIARGGSFEMVFRCASGEVCYSESSAIHSALAFSTATALSGEDCLAFICHTSGPEALFCGLLAPLLAGGASAECALPRNLMRCLKLSSPTKLLCPVSVANALVLKLLRINGRRERSAFPSVQSKKPLGKAPVPDPSYLLLKRLTHPRVSFALGGRLRSVITMGHLSSISSGAFFSFGIYTLSMLSETGLVPALFHYSDEASGVFRLPLGARADLCNVQKGGIGKLIIQSPSVRKGDFISDTYLPLEKRSETALVTPFKGFILKNGSIFVVGE